MASNTERGDNVMALNVGDITAKIIIMDDDSFNPVGAPASDFILSRNTNTVNGVEIRNLNVSTAADMRFAISDETGNYTVLALPSTGNTGGTFFGLARATGTFIYNVGGTTRNLGVGTYGDKDLVLGTNNLARLTIKNTGAIEKQGIVTKYNDIATEGYGHPAIVDDVALLAQSASIGSTNFTNAGVAGLYRLNYYLECTTLNAGATTITLDINFTDDAGAANVYSVDLALTALGRTSGVVCIRLASGNIAYTTTLVDASGLARYALQMSLERLR